MRILIVGGVAGGMSAATRLRRLMEDAEIVVFEKGPHVSFANCGLPYFISGTIADEADLLVQTPASLNTRFNIDVRPNHEVTAINPGQHTIDVQHNGEIITEYFDKLILSTGATPFIPDLPGLNDANNIFSLRNVVDLEAIMAQLTPATKKVAVVGAGFIGLEVAENLRTRGLDVTLIEKANHVLPPLDFEMAKFIDHELRYRGIKVMTNTALTALSDHGHTLLLDNGETLNADLVILAIGVQPASNLAKQAGLTLGLRNGIIVDENYQTSAPNVYAVGDAIIVKNQINGADSLISLASPANRQGRQVADVIAGLPRYNQGSIGTAIVRVFDLAAASTGLNEKQLQAANIKYKTVHVAGNSHASYYPNASELTLKLLFDATTGEIYGAQGVGGAGVAKRIDIIATAIKGGLTVNDLPELELSYAPPFGSAKDPVNMLGYVAQNQLEGISENIQWSQVDELLAQGSVLIDVRNPGELAKGRFKNSINIPLPELRNRLAELDTNQDYIVSCHSGLRSYIAERILKQAGFTVKNLDGAFALYHTALPENLIYPNK